MARLRGTRPGPVRLLAPLLLALLAACSQATRGGPFPQFAELEGLDVRRVTFVGELRLPADSLQGTITTRPTRCLLLFLPVCIPGTSVGRDVYRLDLQELSRDVLRLQLYYRDHGYYGTRVVPSVDRLGDDAVAVRFAVAPGDQVLLHELSVEGTEGVVPPEELEAGLPLREGEPFRRLGFLNAADSVTAALLRRGHAYAQVLRNYSIDTIADVAEVQLVAIPGPLVFVDTIVVEGNERLGERTVRNLLAVRQGDVLRLDALANSQRRLYGVGMVSFASVALAPDSLQLEADSVRATVFARVVEAAQYAVDASAGFGTVDCVRTGARWLNRNFLGGARQLELSANVSKIGVGEPLDAGLEGNLCQAIAEDTLSRSLNYRVAAAFEQPRLFNTRVQLGVNLQSERVTELSAYLRESTGGQLVVARTLGEGTTVLTTTTQIERGRTVATPAVMCVGFETCTTEDLRVLGQSRWSNSYSAAAVHDATRTVGATTRGYLLRGGVDWASPLLGSDDRFLRVLVEGTAHRPLRPGWVLSANLRAGRFLQGSLGGEGGYIPPERRFFAGGPSSVRGYDRNALGPTVYIVEIRPGEAPDEDGASASATGGTQMVVGSLELRTPSPWFGDVTRLAAFVDAGHVSVPGSGLGLGGGPIRVTPGAGLRFLTPVGPFRLDVAYNPYGRDPGPLYYLDAARGRLRLVDRSYEPPAPGFLGRFRFQFALGQAF